MKKIASFAFFPVFALAVIASILVLTGSTLIPFSWILGGYFVSLLLGAVHPGDKTRLQLIFLSAGCALATCAIAFSWGWGGWIPVGICAFMVLTMKIDGGDGYA